jgi:hypothetical protein
LLAVSFQHLRLTVSTCWRKPVKAGCAAGGILALNFDFGDGITSFVQGEVRGGHGLFGGSGKAGIRVTCSNALCLY